MPYQSGSTYLSRRVRTLRNRLHPLQHRTLFDSEEIQMLGRSVTGDGARPTDDADPWPVGVVLPSVLP